MSSRIVPSFPVVSSSKLKNNSPRAVLTSCSLEDPNCFVEFSVQCIVNYQNTTSKLDLLIKCIFIK